MANQPGFLPTPTVHQQPMAPGHPMGPPGDAAWMVKPTGTNCPPGLEYLTQIDQLIIKQKKEILEVITSLETANKYICYNAMGQQVYECKEESNFCVRQMCKAKRPFELHIRDFQGMEVIRVMRPYKCLIFGQCFSCSSCCQDEVEVQSPLGVVVGYVKQEYQGCSITYSVNDADGNVVLQIHGPSYCFCNCFCQDIRFKVMTADGTQEVGEITKKWSNVLQEYFTDADNFRVSFPIDLDVRYKATLIAAVFLIDFMFFEDNESNS